MEGDREMSRNLEPCEICGDKSMCVTHEYTKEGEIFDHPACLIHMEGMVKKYQHTFKNNKW